MPSAIKTPILGLNQWDGNEFPKREDFVDDNLAVETFLKNAGLGTPKISEEVDLNEYTTSGTFVTPPSGLLNLPSGWSQGRHTLLVIGGISYFTQIISSATDRTKTAFRVNSETILGDWYTLWHNGNDGALSGLDADTLDGKHLNSLISFGGGYLSGAITDMPSNTMQIVGNAITGIPVPDWFMGTRKDFNTDTGEITLVQMNTPYTVYKKIKVNGSWVSAWQKYWNNLNDGQDSGLDSDLWRGWKTFKLITEIGLSGTPTIEQIIEAMPDYSKFEGAIGTNANFPANIGQLSVVKLASSYANVSYVKHNGGTNYAKWEGQYNSTQTPIFTGWKPIVLAITPTETVITSGFPTNWSGQVRYLKTQENQATVGVYFSKTTDFTAGSTVFYTLPILANINPRITLTIKVSLRDASDNEVIGSHGYARINTDGTIQLYTTGTLTNARYTSVQFYYPV